MSRVLFQRMVQYSGYYSKYDLQRLVTDSAYYKKYPGYYSVSGSGFSELFKKGKRKVQGVPQSQTAALPRPQEEEENDKSKKAQTEQTYEKH